jgi:hypothetical protein
MTSLGPTGESKAVCDHLASLDFAVVVVLPRRKDCPVSSMRVDLSNNLSRTASTMVGSTLASCQSATGS